MEKINLGDSRRIMYKDKPRRVTCQKVITTESVTFSGGVRTDYQYQWYCGMYGMLPMETRLLYKTKESLLKSL